MNLSFASNDQDDDMKTAVTIVIKRFMNCSPGFSWSTGPIIIPRTAQIQTELCFQDKLESLILKFADFLQSGFTNVDRSEDFPPPTILCFTSLETCHVSFSFLCLFTFFLPTKLSNPVFTHVRLPSNWSLGTTLENKHGEPIHTSTKCGKFPWKRDEIHLFWRCFDSEFSDTSRVNLC